MNNLFKEKSKKKNSKPQRLQKRDFFNNYMKHSSSCKKQKKNKKINFYPKKTSLEIF